MNPFCPVSTILLLEGSVLTDLLRSLWRDAQAPQITGTVETTLNPAGGYCNPKPQCWKSLNPYTVGGVHGKW